MPARHKTLGLFACIIVATGASCSLVTSFDGFTGANAGDGGGNGTGDAHLAADAKGTDTGGSSSSGGTTMDATGGDASGVADTGEDSNGIDSSAPESSAVDSSAVDSSAVDSSAVDSSAPDSGGKDSSAVDSADAGGPISDAGDAASGWCAMQSPSHLFCDDFDEAPLLTGFDAVVASQCAVLLATGNATSAPHAMSAASTAGMQTFNCGATKAYPGLGVAPTTYTLAFDVYVAQADEGNASDAVAAVIVLRDAAGNMWSLQFELTWDTAAHDLGVVLSEDAEFPDGGEAFHETNTFVPLPLATWTRITLQAVMGAQNVPHTGNLFMAGTLVATAALHPTTTNPTLDFTLGYTYIGPQNGSWSLLYDDLTFDAK